MKKAKDTPLMLEIRRLFSECNIELIKAFNYLPIHFDSIKTMESKKVGIYYHLKKLIPCFSIFNEISLTDSIQSLLTIERMILDNYAILYLFSNHSTIEEQNLRYYLYLLDAVNSRTKLIMDFHTKSTLPIPSEIVDSAYSTVETDKKTINDIKRIIIQNKLDSLVNEKITENYNWKYKDPKSSNKFNSYKWVELYEIAKIPSHHAKMLQNFNSSYVHGLGLSIMIDDEFGAITKIGKSMDFCSILQTLIVKLILNEFPNETKDIEFPTRFENLMFENWNSWK